MTECKRSHEIHTSERMSFRGCRRRWNWIFIDNYYPIETPKPLEFGTAYHKAMEAYYNPSTWQWHEKEETRQMLELRAIKIFVDKCESQKAKYLSRTDRERLDEDVATDYTERVELGIGMLKYYFSIAPPLDKFKTLSTEQQFTVPVINPDTGEQLLCQCGKPIVYDGRIDMLCEDEFGDYWIFDWKTARSIQTDDTFLYLDDQITSYCWALQMVLGIKVRGFIYHEQKKSFPVPPKENKFRRKGCLYSVSKNQDCTEEMYREWVMEHDVEAYEAGLYDGILLYLHEDGAPFYRRSQIHRTQTELESAARNIFLEAKEMYRPDLPIYPSPGRFACGFCAFRQPCLGKNDGSDYQYTLDTLFETREPYYLRDRELSSDKNRG